MFFRISITKTLSPRSSFPRIGLGKLTAEPRPVIMDTGMGREAAGNGIGHEARHTALEIPLVER